VRNKRVCDIIIKMPIKLSYKKPIIDFHTHIFPEPLYAAIKSWFVNNVNWEFYFKGNSMEAFKFLDDIPNIEKFVAFGYAHKPGISLKLNEFYVNLKSISEKVMPLATIHQEDDVITVANMAFDSGLAGFKIHCQVQKVSPSDKRFEPLYKIVQERDGFILFHAGTAPFPSGYTGFVEFSKFLKKFPKVKTVVAHLGAFESENFLKAAIDYENLYLDTSYAFIANPTNRIDAPLKLIEQASNKIFYGSDFPGICHSYEDGVKALLKLNLDEQTLDKIFYFNARDFLSI